MWPQQQCPDLHCGYQWLLWSWLSIHPAAIVIRLTAFHCTSLHPTRFDCHYSRPHPSLSLHHTPHCVTPTPQPSLSLNHTTPSHMPHPFGLRRWVQHIGLLRSYHIKSKWILKGWKDRQTDQRMWKQVLCSVPHPRPAHLDWVFCIVCHVTYILGKNNACHVPVLHEWWEWMTLLAPCQVWTVCASMCSRHTRWETIEKSCWVQNPTHT